MTVLRLHYWFLGVLIGLIFPVNVFAQEAKPCLADELHLHLKQLYPQGVPGRMEASSEKTDYSFNYVIPVVFHIMHSNGPEMNVTLAQMQSQIDVLNEDYNRLGLGFNTHPDGGTAQITFCLATKDPNGAPHPGYEYFQYANAADIDPFTQDTMMKRINRWDSKRYLNIWTVRRIAGGTIRGYAYFPDEVAGTVWDGLVIDHRYMGRAAGTAISLGRTATHEVGHYLGLLHPWGLQELGCFSVNDDCDDTPAVMDSYFAIAPLCNGPEGCDNVTPRQTENYMDYSADLCMNMFTICQVDKMRYNIARYRAALIGVENLGTTGCTEVADSLPVQSGFSLFPNPARDEILVMASEDLEASSISYVVYDTRGMKMKASDIPFGPIAPIAIDLKDMAMGIYIIEVTAGNNVWVEKFIIDR